MALGVRFRRLSPGQRRVAKIVAIVLGALVAVQVFYPRSYTLPNTSIVGSYSGFRSRGSVEDGINRVSDSSKLTILVGKEKINTSMPEVGVKIDAKKTITPVLRYPFWQRLIPFSLFLPHTSANYAIASDNAQKTKGFVASLQKHDLAPVNANVTLKGETVNVAPAKEGFSYSDGGQVKALEQAGMDRDFTIRLSKQVTQAKITTQSAQKTADTITKQLKAQFTISVENQVETVERTEVASWIIVTPDDSKGQLVIGYDKEKIKPYLQPYADKVYVAGVAKKVTTLDGQVVSEVSGSPGRAMKLDASVDEVVKALTAAQGSAKTIVQAVTPAAQVTANYTRTSKGLQVLINDWVKAHKGTYYISLKTAAGDITASHNAAARIYPASIYKTYLADVAYAKAANGQLDLNAEVVPGKSAAACIDLMIVRSDNPCAYAVGDAVGWDANNGLLASQGFGSTTLKKQGWNTTANDTVNFMIKLNNGGLLNAEHTSSLLGMMHRQIYRNGIAAGSAGSVANKVGFIDNYNHDAGIVYHPNGTYALVIMTTSSSFASIADLSRQISNVMSQ